MCTFLKRRRSLINSKSPKMFKLTDLVAVPRVTSFEKELRKGKIRNTSCRNIKRPKNLIDYYAGQHGDHFQKCLRKIRLERK